MIQLISNDPDWSKIGQKCSQKCPTDLKWSWLIKRKVKTVVPQKWFQWSKMVPDWSKKIKIGQKCSAVLVWLVKLTYEVLRFSQKDLAFFIGSIKLGHFQTVGILLLKKSF